MTITLDGTTGITTPGLTNTGTETLVNLTTTGNTTLGDATTDTLTVGVTGIVKDASGNVGIGTASPQSSLQVSGPIISAPTGTGVHIGVQTNIACIQLNSGAALSSLIDFSTSGTDYLGRILYDNSGNSMQFSTNNTERMRIDSSGNVGIGNTTPSSFDVTGKPLVVGSGSGNQGITIYAGTTGYSTVNFADGTTGTDRYSGQVSYDHTNNALLFATTTGLERMRIDSSGNVLVGGTSNGGAILHAQRSTSAVVGRYYNSMASGFTSDLLQAIVDQGSSSACTLLGIYYSGGATFAFRVRGDGVLFAQNTTVQSASDIRFKENIVNSTDGLNVINALRPVRFDLKEGHGVSAKINQLGFIAQEVQPVFPDAIETWKESDDPENPYLSLGTTSLIPVLVKAIQEQQALIQSLTTRITALETPVVTPTVTPTEPSTPSTGTQA